MGLRCPVVIWRQSQEGLPHVKQAMPAAPEQQQRPQPGMQHSQLGQDSSAAAERSK